MNNAGASHDPAVLLSGLDNLVPFTRTTTAFVPVTQLSENLNWTRGKHTFQFGTDLFLIRDNHISDANSYSDVQTNPVYLDTGGIAGTSSPLDPGNHRYPAVDSNFGPNYDQAIAILLGIFKAAQVPEWGEFRSDDRAGGALPTQQTRVPEDFLQGVGRRLFALPAFFGAGRVIHGSAKSVIACSAAIHSPNGRVLHRNSRCFHRASVLGQNLKKPVFRSSSGYQPCPRALCRH